MVAGPRFSCFSPPCIESSFFLFRHGYCVWTPDRCTIVSAVGFGDCQSINILDLSPAMAFCQLSLQQAWLSNVPRTYSYKEMSEDEGRVAYLQKMAMHKFVFIDRLPGWPKRNLILGWTIFICHLSHVLCLRSMHSPADVRLKDCQLTRLFHLFRWTKQSWDWCRAAK